MSIASITLISCATHSARRARLLFLVLVSGKRHANLSAIIQSRLPPNVDAGERMKESKNVQKPQRHANDHDCIQDGLDRSLHWYEAVDQPKQKTHHDQNHQYVK
jgi:hypothetical protein